MQQPNIDPSQLQPQVQQQYQTVPVSSDELYANVIQEEKIKNIISQLDPENQLKEIEMRIRGFKKNALTNEWERKNPKQRLEELTADENVFDFKQFKAGFKKHEPSIDMLKIYTQFKPEDVAELEKELKEDPDAYYECFKISKILPFIKKTMPRVGNDQSVFGLSIICLPRKYFDEEKVVRYGLEPLTKAGILTDVEVKKIVNWFKKTEPTWDSDNRKGFAKTFKIDGITYKLMTDCCRGYRDLNLHIHMQS